MMTIGTIRKRLTKKAFSDALKLASQPITTTAAREIARAGKRKRATIKSTTEDVLFVAKTIQAARQTARPPAARHPSNVDKTRRYRGRHLGRYDAHTRGVPTLSELLTRRRNFEVSWASGKCLRSYVRQSEDAISRVNEFKATSCTLCKETGWIEYKGSKNRIGVTDAHYVITVQRGWMSLPDWLRTCGGLLTLAAIELPQEREGETVYRARWARQASGDVAVDEGFIVRLLVDGDEYTSHGKTLGGARSVITRQLPAYRAAKTERDRVRGEKIEKIKKQIASKLESGNLNGYDVQVTLRDSDRAGNCQQGASAWVARHFDGRVSASVSEILAIDDQHDRALLACVAAVRRTVVMPITATRT